MRPELTIERLKEVLLYDPLTGHFYWIGQLSSRCGVNKPAGSPNAKGYIRIGIDGRYYLAHRLAWFYQLGVWPDCFLDHRDMNKSNNIWSNIRAADVHQNQYNVGLTKRNKSGVKGVHYDAKRNKYCASIAVSGVNYRIGRFATLEQATVAYSVAAEKLHGEFARTQ
jgi:hypothetical protein